MSYRTYVEGRQLFGNNDYFPKWIEFVESQGIKVNQDGCYKGYITDVQGAIEVIEEIVLNLEKDSNVVFDMSSVREDIALHSSTLTDRLMTFIDFSYAFTPVMFINACSKKIKKRSSNDRVYNYELLPGKKIKVEAR